MVAVELSKIIVVVVNLVLMVFGLAVLILGILFKVSWDDVRDAFEVENADIYIKNAGDTLTVSCIVFGAFILILSLIGCVGGCCRIRFLLVVYAIVVIVILIAQIVVVAFVAVNAKDEDLSNKLKDALHGYREDSGNDQSKGWSAIFDIFECCGIKDYKDFNSTNFVKSQKRLPSQASYNIPVTCCKDMSYKDPLTQDVFKMPNIDKCVRVQDTNFVYTTGCETKVRGFIDDNKSIMIGVGITIFVTEIVVVILAFSLCCRNDD